MPDNEAASSERPLDLRFTCRGKEYVLRLGLPEDEPALEGPAGPERDFMLSVLERHRRGPHRLDGPGWAEELFTRKFGDAVEILEKGPGTEMDSDLPPGAIP